ncbi:magnesium transporter [Candidatus Bipolaricaulota bacterium]|nr:magnesium transporter [Candidatus Bipolaricaulota bacterium]
MAKKALNDLHPVEAADKLRSLSDSEAAERIEELDLDFAAEVFESMDPWQVSGVFRELSGKLQARILERMEPDDSVDLLQELSPETRQVILGRIDSLTRKRLGTLLKYPPDTAGGTMSPEVLSLPENMTVGNAVDRLRKREEEYENINYVYVTDQDGNLTGVLPLRNFAFREPELRLSEVMNPEVQTVSPDLDREKVARLFDKYDYLALPVVNDEGRLLGVITVDDVIDILRQEDTEDMLEMVGISDAREESVWTPWRTSMKHRLPWLVINLGTALLAAIVVSVFESTIAKYAVLAVFMPVIAGQGGNSGSQTVTLLIRGIALGEITDGQSYKALVKEATLGLLHGLSIGIIVGLIAFFWNGSGKVALIVGVSMVLSMIVAGIAGVLIPVGLKKVGLDPALSANIWMTTVTDVAGFFFLLGLASWLLM